MLIGVQMRDPATRFGSYSFPAHAREGDVHMQTFGNVDVAASASTTSGFPLSRRRLVTQFALAMMLALTMLGTLAGFQAEKASAGLAGTINADGVGLMAAYSDQSIVEWMYAGERVDVLWGPENGKYEVRYYGIDGWVWADYLDVDGAGAAAVGSSGGSEVNLASAVPVAERWIDVNRSSGLVSLMVGNTVQASYWGSMGYDTSADGFYATAVGTYYIYGFDGSLHYTPYADNYISHWIAFDSQRFNGFHSYTKDAWGNILPNGGGLTGGCVALAPGDIDAVWAFAEGGMRVEVHF